MHPLNFSFLITTTFFIKPVDDITDAIQRATRFGPGTFATAFVPGNLFNKDDTILKPPEGLVNFDEGDLLPGIGFTTIIDLASVSFSAVFLIIGTITLFSFAGLLFVRYITLGILIIILPIAWVTWIFPGLSVGGGHPFKQWWAQFIKWLLFAPISMFFFWLSVRAVNMSGGALPTSGSEKFFLLPEAAGVIGDMIIIIGLMIGGMIVANKMGVTGSNAALALAKKTGNWAKKNATDKTKLYGARVVSAPLRTEKGRERVENLQKSTGLKRFIGQKLNIAGGKSEKFIKDEAKKKIKDLNPKRLADMVPTLREPELMEALNALREKESLGLVDMKKYIGDEGTQKIFKKHGRGKDYEKIEKAMVMNTAMVKALEAGDDTKLDEETEKFHKSYKGSDLKLISGALFKDPNKKENILKGFTEDEFKKLRSADMNSVFQNLPGATAKIRAQLDHDSLIEFQNELESTIKYLEEQFVLDPRIDKDEFEKMDVKQKIGVIQETYDVEAASVMSSLYSSRKNFGSSIFGSMPTFAQTQQAQGDAQETQ